MILTVRDGIQSTLIDTLVIWLLFHQFDLGHVSLRVSLGLALFIQVAGRLGLWHEPRTPHTLRAIFHGMTSFIVMGVFLMPKSLVIWEWIGTTATVMGLLDGLISPQVGRKV